MASFAFGAIPWYCFIPGSALGSSISPATDPAYASKMNLLSKLQLRLGFLQKQQNFQTVVALVKDLLKKHADT
jgi:hypothetical protein